MYRMQRGCMGAWSDLVRSSCIIRVALLSTGSLQVAQPLSCRHWLYVSKEPVVFLDLAVTKLISQASSAHLSIYLNNSCCLSPSLLCTETLSTQSAAANQQAYNVFYTSSTSRAIGNTQWYTCMTHSLLETSHKP